MQDSEVKKMGIYVRLNNEWDGGEEEREGKGGGRESLGRSAICMNSQPRRSILGGDED